MLESHRQRHVSGYPDMNNCAGRTFSRTPNSTYTSPFGLNGRDCSGFILGASMGFVGKAWLTAFPHAGSSISHLQVNIGYLR